MSVTPDFIGQIYKDTNTGNLWRANSLTPGDWTLEVQNMQVKWTPHNIKLGERVQISAWADATPLAGVTALEFRYGTNVNGFDIENAANLLTISGPGVVTYTESPTSFYIASCPLLTSISFPDLVSVETTVTIDGCASLTSVNFDSLVSTATVSVKNCPILSSLAFPSYVSPNTKGMDLTGNALDAASINGILANFVANAGWVSGTLDLNGGTNSAPTGQGLIDKATLIARGGGFIVINTNP